MAQLEDLENELENITKQLKDLNKKIELLLYITICDYENWEDVIAIKKDRLDKIKKLIETI